MSLIIIGRAVQFILLMIVIRVATTVLPPNEMGRMSLITAITVFYALFLINPVGMFINRRFHSWNVLGRAKYYLKVHWIYLLAISMVAAGSLVLLNQSHSLAIKINNNWLLMLVCGSLIFSTINQTTIPSLNMLEFRGWFVTLTLATIVLSLIIAYLLTRNFIATAEYWLLGLLVGQAIIGCVGVKLLFDQLKSASDTSPLTRGHVFALLNYAWPVAVSVVFNWFQTQSYRFFIADSLGLTALGLFVAGYGISAGLMAAFESVLTTYFQPHFYKLISNNNLYEQSLAWSNYAGAILPSLLLVSFLLASLAPELTQMMLGPSYQSASQFMVWGIVAEGARIVYGVYSMSAHAKMKTRLLLIPNLFGAVISIFLVWVLVPLIGTHGVGLALAVASLGVLLSMHYRIIIPLHMTLPYRLMSKAAALGATLMGLIVVGRWVIGSDNSMTAVALIMIAGIVFLPMFYYLLYPYLPTHEKTP